MIASEKVLEKVDNRLRDMIGRRVGMPVRLEGGMKTGKAGVGAVMEAGVGLAATPRGFVEDGSIEVWGNDIVGAAYVECGAGTHREGLQFRLR